MLALHRRLGLAVGLFVLLNSVTGAVLIFSDEVDRLLNPSLLTVVPESERLPLDTLAQRTRTAAPGCTITDMIAGDLKRRDHALLVRLICAGTPREAVVNPYTGAVIGIRDNYFVKGVFTLHTTLLLNDWGRIALFCIAVAFMTMSLSGAVSHGRLLKTFTNPIARGLAVRPKLSDVHRAIGVVVILFNLVIGASGAWLTSGAVLRLFGGSRPTLAATPDATIALDSAVASARRALPGFQVNWIAFPRSAAAPVGFWGEVPSAWVYGPYGSIVNLDARTGQVVDVTDVRNAGVSAKLSALAVSLHFGHFGGITIKIVWCLAAFAVTCLAVSGPAMWALRRRPPF